MVVDVVPQPFFEILHAAAVITSREDSTTRSRGIARSRMRCEKGFTLVCMSYRLSYCLRSCAFHP